MLTINIPLSSEGWDEEKQEFVEPETLVLHLEHSLVSLSKWEAKWHKSFLHTKDKTTEETMDYIKCMILDDDIDPVVLNRLTPENVGQINDYINNPMTATTVPEDKSGKGNREIVTAELIYYWMISLTIPFECKDWHLNQLITLIRVCQHKNTPPKKQSKGDIMSRNAALNAARRAQLNSKG